MITVHNRRKVGWWGAFIDSLDTGGAYVLGFFAVMGIGIYLIKIGYDMYGFGLLSGASGAFFGRTKDGMSNREHADASQIHTETTTTTDTPPPVMQSTTEGKTE